MSYYNQQHPPVGVPPWQGYPPAGYHNDEYAAPGYLSWQPHGFRAPEYVDQYRQSPSPGDDSSSTGFMEGCLAVLCCRCHLDA